MSDSAFSYFHPKFVISLYCFRESLQKVTSNTGMIKVISKLSLLQAVIHNDIYTKRTNGPSFKLQMTNVTDIQKPVETYLHILQDEAT